MTPRAWGAEYRSTTVCIDSYENGIPIGHFYNPYLSERQSFCGITQFLIKMEKALDTMDFPQAFTAIRTFAPIPERNGHCQEEYRPGTEATFVIRVLFRQNTSWQGSVTWVEEQKEQRFRSVLELILLIDSALSYERVS